MIYGCPLVTPGYLNIPPNFTYRMCVQFRAPGKGTSTPSPTGATECTSNRFVIYVVETGDGILVPWSPSTIFFLPPSPPQHYVYSTVPGIHFHASRTAGASLTPVFVYGAYISVQRVFIKN